MRQRLPSMDIGVAIIRFPNLETPEEPMNKINNNFYLTCALAVSIGIFFVAGRPPVSNTLNGSGLHWVAHMVTYGILAACYVKGLPRMPVLLVGCLTVAIGGLHELYEVVRYDIGYEFHDLFYDAVGALAGVLLARRARLLFLTS